MEMKNQIKKCTRCGLCAKVCPVFEYEKSEVRLARGKFLQLLGIFEGKLKFNKKIMKNIKYCLNCSKCTQNCPSEIDTVRLFSEIKYNNMSFIEKILTSEFVFDLKLIPLNFFNVFKKRLFLKKGEIYFRGCVPNYSNKSENVCCGIPYKTSGRLDIYNDLVKKNMAIIESDFVEKVYFDCASCLGTVSKYPFKNPETVKKLTLLHPLNMTEDKIWTMHKPCHLDEKTFLELEEKLKQLPNYVSMYKNHDFNCCGFGGAFFMEHPKLAHKMSVKNAEKIIASGAKFVVSPCPVCSISIWWGLTYLKLFKGQNHKVRLLKY